MEHATQGHETSPLGWTPIIIALSAAPSPMAPKVKLEEFEPQSKRDLSTPKKKSKQSVWTDDQIKLLCRLRQDGKSWPSHLILSKCLNFREINQYFPERTEHALQVTYSVRRQEFQEHFTPAKVPLIAKTSNVKDSMLKDAIDNYEKRMWKHIGKEIGMSPNGCKKRAAELKFHRK